MKTLKLLDIAFKSNDYTYAPDEVTLELSDEKIKAIEKATQILNENPEFCHINIAYYDASWDNEDDWRSDYMALKVYRGGSIYFYAQSKWDAGDQIESEVFYLN
jgi:hypothetical protein